MLVSKNEEIAKYTDEYVLASGVLESFYLRVCAREVDDYFLAGNGQFARTAMSTFSKQSLSV